jgi:phospholipid transport system substrate-binding protein
MNVTRGLLAAVAVATVLFTASVPARAADVEAAKNIVKEAVDDGLARFVGKNHPLDERAHLLEGMIRRYTDPKMMSADILGRYWPKLSVAEQDEFSELFVGYLVSSYGPQLVDVPPAHIEITTAEDLGERVLVHSVATSEAPGSVPTPADWTVASTAEGRPVIAGVSVEGVSLIKAMKDDFGAVLRSNSGKIQPLMAALRRKIEAPQ